MPATVAWWIVAVCWVLVIVVPFAGTLLLLFHYAIVEKSGFIPAMAVLGAGCFFLARSVAIMKALGYLA